MYLLRTGRYKEKIHGIFTTELLLCETVDALGETGFVVEEWAENALTETRKITETTLLPKWDEYMEQKESQEKEKVKKEIEALLATGSLTDLNTLRDLLKDLTPTESNQEEKVETIEVPSFTLVEAEEEPETLSTQVLISEDASNDEILDVLQGAYKETFSEVEAVEPDDSFFEEDDSIDELDELFEVGESQDETPTQVSLFGSESTTEEIIEESNDDDFDFDDDLDDDEIDLFNIPESEVNKTEEKKEESQDDDDFDFDDFDFESMGGIDDELEGL